MEMKYLLITGIAITALVAIGATMHFMQPKVFHDKATLMYHEQINNIAQQVNAMNTTWKAGENTRWQNMGMEAIKGQMGSLEDNETVLEVVDTVAANIPDTFDARTAWPNCQSIKEIRDQANCGSCWAFGAAEAMSDRICIASGQTRQDKISTQHLVTCCSICGQGCNGGYPKQAWNQYKTYGLVSGDLYADTNWCQAYSLPPCDHHTTGQYNPCPASVPTPKCEKQCTNKAYPKSFEDDRHFASKAYSVSSNVAAIQTDIMTNGPVEASFSVYEDFLAYKTGVYQHTTGQMLGGHAIKIFGWGVEGSTPYWLVANSWNEDWGDKGTFKILRGKNECGIEGGVVAGIPKL